MDNLVRFSLDIPSQQHMHLKMLATKKGMSMRDYVLEALAYRESFEGKENLEIDNESFQKALKSACKKHFKLGQNLSKR